MRFTLAILLILLSTATLQGRFRGYPQLPKLATSIEEFVVDGWEIFDSSEGDLNKDGFADVALVLQSLDSIPADGDDDWSIPYYPRILAIAFWDKEADGYRLKAQSNKFIITTEGNGTMEEPYSGMEIRKNGTLRFDFTYWYSAGTWYMGSSTYIFRYQNNRFELIGQETESMHRATMATSKTSINYSTRKAILFTSDGEDDKGKTETASFELDELPTLKTVGAAEFVPAIQIPWKD